ncbi:hypothetical protein Cgig2_023065 [Carnegiea gigantea]|uniref:Poly(A) polymerase nucleotidyltransferase domain-containing protein n=1 Tax=Carnegiea gigantea TaxID=171969 RepID=A0A9Q1JXK6_9CARY|nr:hypothetical protein Cgig2_023065 [Carnegiea gigantea]
MNNLVFQLSEFVVKPSNNRVGTLKINQSFNLSLWVSSSQRIGASESGILAISKDVLGESTENPRSNNGHSSVFEDIVSVVSVGEFLVDSGLYESKDKAVKRQEALGKLNEIVKLLVKNVSHANGYNDQVVEESNAKILSDEVMLVLLHGVLDFFPESFG